ncbi:MAG: bifunctional DNA-binding transcriptional regulator/O6-methylguanine-DNA methyltransferase Ada [Desulfococcaceae bacterium]
MDFSEEPARWRAVVARDARADGVFWYGVLTTGIYCRPSCSSRKPKPENVRFFDAWEAAEVAGHRPCKKCFPRQSENEDRNTRAALRACEMIAAAEDPPALQEIADHVGMSPFHFHRLFKRIVGVTPREFAVIKRWERTRAELENGGTVTEAMYQAGFSSSSRFYETATENLGMTPAVYRRKGKGMSIQSAAAECVLGWVLVAATETGICAISFGDDPGELERELRERFAGARFSSPDETFGRLVRAVIALVEKPGEGNPDLPLDIQGTVFQRKVWTALRGIPPGRTATYSEIAERIGQPDAVRAVARACASNPVAVAIPCHRVVRKNGEAGGYRWGVERKKRLLEQESAQKKGG